MYETDSITAIDGTGSAGVAGLGERTATVAELKALEGTVTGDCWRVAASRLC